jgi:hypothetical protein
MFQESTFFSSASFFILLYCFSYKDMAMIFWEGEGQYFSIFRKTSFFIRTKAHTQVHSQAISQNWLQPLERNKI